MQLSLACRVLMVPLCAITWLKLSPANGAELLVDTGSKGTLTSEELLARPDATTIRVPADVSYGGSMTYRAVPLNALLGPAKIPADQDLQITGTDGFVTNLPSQLLTEAKGAVPWLAIEPPNDPWPLTPGGLKTGPFYLVWLNPEASHIRSEQWPFQVASIRTVPAHAVRWPQLAVGDDVPAESPARQGQLLFATQCMVCHQMSGAGDAVMGPDLNVPHNPTEYFQPWALRAYIRDPGSIRVWSEMKMPGFGETALSNSDLDAIIAYLTYMAARHR